MLRKRSFFKFSVDPPRLIALLLAAPRTSVLCLLTMILSILAAERSFVILCPTVILFYFLIKSRATIDGTGA